MKHRFGKDNWYHSEVSQYDLNGNFIQDFGSINEANRFLNVKNSNISMVCRGLRKTACGYIWKYKNL